MASWVNYAFILYRSELIIKRVECMIEGYILRDALNPLALNSSSIIFVLIYTTLFSQCPRRFAQLDNANPPQDGV